MLKKQTELPDPNEQDFSNMVTMWKIETYEISAKNKVDAEMAIRVNMGRKDELISLIPKRGTIYEAKVRIFNLRDGPNDAWM